MAGDGQSQILSLSGDGFFAALEKELNTEIPSSIKKVLSFFEYKSAIVLARFDDSSIISIEDDLRNNFHSTMLLDGETMEQFLGRFAKCQSNFKILDGQKKWFDLIAETCRRLMGAPAPTLVANTTNDDAPSVENGNFKILEFLIDDLLTTFNPGDASNNQSNDPGVLIKKKYDKESLFKLIGSQMITVFTDAKRITLSAFSWPAREVASQLATNFKSFGIAVPKIDLLYVNPSHHEDLLNSIVQSDLERFKSCLSDSLAISLRIDGSVDRSQKHNVYVLMHVVTDSGKLKTFFLGFDIPIGNSALSYHLVTKKIAEDILPWDLLFQLSSSLVTDGEAKNTGHLSGLWQRLKQEKEGTSNRPFITIWCIGHRLSLGWKSTSNLPIVDNLIKNLIAVSSHFHQSGEKTRLLAAIATEKNLNVPLHYPQYFAIRWTEYTHNLLYVFLRNWNSMIWHFKTTKELGFQYLWLSADRLRLTAFVCDVLTVLKTFQKAFQSNTISILHLPSKRIKLLEDLASLKSASLENGWEATLLTQMVTSPDGTITLHDHKLLTDDRLRSGPFKFSTADRENIIDSLVHNLNEYLTEDIDIQNGLAPLLNLNSNEPFESLKRCHSMIVPESDIEDFYIEYTELSDLLSADEKKDALHKILEIEKNSTKRFGTLKLALARALAIKPHSADVENIINVYNKYKDTDREPMSKRTLFNNIYVHTNMCTLVEFDPTLAANHWLNQKERKPRYGSKSMQQEWYKGIFPEANEHKRQSNRKIEL